MPIRSESISAFKKSAWSVLSVMARHGSLLEFFFSFFASAWLCIALYEQTPRARSVQRKPGLGGRGRSADGAKNIKISQRILRFALVVPWGERRDAGDLDRAVARYFSLAAAAALGVLMITPERFVFLSKFVQGLFRLPEKRVEMKQLYCAEGEVDGAVSSKRP